MHVTNEIYPTDPERLKALMEEGPPGPIYMVNLLKFKEKAEYTDGRTTDLSGRAAYMIYADAVTTLLPTYGGKAIFAGDVTHLTLGVVEELWDEVSIAMYPNRRAMAAMSMSDQWRAIAVHRTAGLKGQLNIETTALPGAAFMAAFEK